MIQDIFPHQYDNQYRREFPGPEDCLLLFSEKKILLWREEKIVFPLIKEVPQLESASPRELHYLFSIDKVRFFTLTGEKKYTVEKALLNRGYVYASVLSLRYKTPQVQAFAGESGWHLYDWYESHRFCGRCGHVMEEDIKERMMRCPICHQMEYPKICPAIIAAVTDQDRIVLTKYAGREYKNFGLVAGFNEIGETLEETVAREVMEEVGLSVKNIRYYKSQPWSFTQTLLMGFVCEVDGSTAITLDRDELSMATWMRREDIPLTGPGISLTNEMMWKFKTRQL